MIQEHPHGHVEDTPELEAYYQELESANLAPLWTTLATSMPNEPQPKARPFLWRYGDVRPRLLRAGDLVRPEQANRRVIMLINPGLKEELSASSTLYANLQMVLPGEIAPAHRHSQAALRFIMEGGGGYTAVDGEKTLMYPGDLVLTPSWTWHEYGNPFTGASIMPTIGANAQLLRPGEHTQAHRHTIDVVYQAVEGSGSTIINGVRFDWEKNDIFVIPKWAFHEHVNRSKADDAC